MTDNVYRSICEDILADEAASNIREDFLVAVEKMDDVSVTIYDAIDERRYTIRNPEHIGRDYLASILRFSDDAAGIKPAIDRETLLDFLDAIDKVMLTTVTRIFFVTGDEEETDSINQDTLFAEGIEAGHGIDEELLGEVWWDMDVVLVNLKTIRDACEEIAFDRHEFLREYNRNILTTLVHEIRHTAQANAYLQDKHLRLLCYDKEEDAEEYATLYVAEHPAHVLEEQTDSRI